VLIGAAVMTAVHGKGRILFYAWPVAAGIVGFTFLVALLSSGLGVLVSLRAATVRQASQAFSIGFFLLFVPLFVLPLLPASLKARLAAAAAKLDGAAVALVFALLLLVVDAVLLLIADARFRRNRLILD
jgi:ABC-2 type transport system permease protein